MKNVLTVLGFIMLLGLVGHLDYQAEVMTTKQDEINKQMVTQDLEFRCYTGDIPAEYCNGILNN
jgi:hypothetical protein